MVYVGEAKALPVSVESPHFISVEADACYGRGVSAISMDCLEGPSSDTADSRLPAKKKPTTTEFNESCLMRGLMSLT